MLSLLKLPIGLIISLADGSASLSYSRYSRKSSAGKQAVCVCCLTAALIRPLWVRLIGPVIRDAALPPSPARWITSHRRLLRFQDKWTEGESITPQEGREREGGRNTLQRYWWGPRSRKCWKKKVKQKQQAERREGGREGGRGVIQMKWIAQNVGRKRERTRKGAVMETGLLLG